MMLVAPDRVLANALDNRYALGAFNTYNLEITLGILGAAVERRSPILIQLGASALAWIDRDPITAMVMAGAQAANVPVVVHLDHARDLSDIQDALARGFTSVMFDGSTKPFRENIATTREAAKLAHAANVWIEGELGAVSGKEDSSEQDISSTALTDPDLAARFVEETNVDSLAVAIGNQHGYYRGEPKLDIERLKAIHDRLSVPLVLHGASGLPDEAIRDAIQLGVVKINVNTDLRKAYLTTLQKTALGAAPTYDFIQAAEPAIEAVSEVVMRKIDLFGSAGRAE